MKDVDILGTESKIKPLASKIYKPEILVCPKCKSGLKYKYTVSNKVVQFTSGKYFRIKNLGYSCPNCNDSNVYISQTANKLSFKGYTYSSKIICMIDYYKLHHMGREGICDILTSKGIEISDRNIDILYRKFKALFNMDYNENILNAYKDMIDEFKEIRLSIDFITINELRYVIIYNYFNGELLAIWRFEGLQDPELKNKLSKYLSNNKITLIASVRGISKFLPILKSIAPEKTKFIPYMKF